MRVLFTTLREESHFLPMIPFIGACKRRGHEVAVSAPPDFAERVAETGATFFPFGHPGDEGLRPITARTVGAPVDDVKRIVIGEIFAGACAAAAIPKLIETMQHFKPHVVARESFEFAGLIAAEEVGIPHMRVAICAQGTEGEIRSLAAQAVDGHRRNLGLSPDPCGERIRGEGAVTLFPESFEGPKGEASSILRFRAARRGAETLPDWWPGQDGPFVYATLGTVAGRFETMQDAYRAALGAFAGVPIRVLLTIGAKLPIEALGEVPPNVHVERFVPQDDVLPHAAAVLCHGGSGSVLGALAAGVPMVVTPIFADQPYNAERVAAIGAGLAVPNGERDSGALRKAISRVLAEESFRVAARRIAEEIATLPLVDDAATAMESFRAG